MSFNSRIQLILVLILPNIFWSGAFAQSTAQPNIPENQQTVGQTSNVNDIPLPPLPKDPNTSNNNSGQTEINSEELSQLLNEIKTLEAQNNAASSTSNTTQGTTQSPVGTIYDPVFQNLIRNKFPMTPQQIKALREVFQTQQRAKVSPVEVPTPTVSTRNVLLSPGAVPPVIKMATGYVSSIVFLDETGQPWPIANFSIGNPNAFNVKWDQKSNILMIQGQGAYDTGNIAIRLQGLETPVMLTMFNDQKTVDYRVDLRVQGRGPNAKSSIIGNVIPEKANSALITLLDGIAPMGSSKLSVKGGPAEAWLQGNSMFVRTRLTILSPSWTGTMQSADGMRVYELHATPLILASMSGKTIQLRVEGL